MGSRGSCWSVARRPAVRRLSVNDPCLCASMVCQSGPNAFAERVVRAWRFFVPPLDVARGARLEVDELNAVARRGADLGENVANPFPHQQQLTPILVEQFPTQHTGLDE